MVGRLAGKTCLVTAAGQGIGRASAERFAAEGARVIATDIDEAALESLSGVEARRLDVTDAGAIRGLVAEARPARRALQLRRPCPRRHDPGLLG